MAGMGQPLPTNVTTQVIVDLSVRRRQKGVPALALNGLPQSRHLKRGLVWPWMRMLPCPLCPLAGQSMFGQNTSGECIDSSWCLATHRIVSIRSPLFQVLEPRPPFSIDLPNYAPAAESLRSD